MHSVVHVNLHCRVASSHLHRPRANVERDVHFKKELDFLIYMRRLAAGVKPCQGFARILSELGKEAQQHGITLSLHHHYDQPVMYRQDFEVFFEAVGDQFVKLTVDTAHLVKSGITNIVEIFRDYHQVIDNVVSTVAYFARQR